MVAFPAVMAGAEVREIAAVWLKEIPTARDGNQLQQVVDNLLGVYKEAITKGLPLAQMDGRGQYPRELTQYLAQRSGYTEDDARDFCFALETAYLAGSIDDRHYNPVAASEVAEVVKELEPGLWTQFTEGIVKPYVGFLERNLTKVLIIGAAGGVVYLLIRYGGPRRERAVNYGKPQTSSA